MTNTYPEETEDGRDSLMVMDPERLKIFVDYMESHPVGLVCSPPHSGKTTLGMQLHKHYLTNNYNTVYISLATLESNPHAHSYEGFNEFWMSKTDSSWTSISSSIVPTRIIVDEAQVIYDNAGFFWGTLKELSSTQYKHNIRVLLLGTHHPTYKIMTPMTFPDSLGLSSLHLIEDEFGWSQACMSKSDKGDSSSALLNLYQKFPNGGSPEDMLKHLASKIFLNHLSSSHALYWVHNWQPTDQEATFLHRLLLKCDPDSTFEFIDCIGNPTIEIFLKIGIIIEDYSYEKMYFAAPIMRIVLSNQLFTAPVNMQNLPTKTFDELLVWTIERISSSVLKNSFGQGYDSYLLEQTWQMEWYCTAKSAIPENPTISPDGGQYEVIPMNDWAILDFHHHSKCVRNLMPNFWYILYSDDYEQVTIVRHDKEDCVLHLIGDDFK
nr:7452_t:CDS:2 [Entrophospora candida]